MYKFAVMTLHYNGRGEYCNKTKSGGFIGRAAAAYRAWKADRRIKIAATIHHLDRHRELGYILEIPGFILRWNTLSLSKRKKRLFRFIQLIKESGIQFMCVPFFHDLIPAEVVEHLENQLLLSNGSNIRIITMIQCLRHLMGILKNQLSGIEAGVWCADTDMGRLLAMELVPFLNFIILGGRSTDKLFRLSDEIMNETGLACPVTTDLKECLKDRQLVILTHECDIRLLKNALIVVYAGPLNLDFIEEIRKYRGPFWILSGWTELPEEIKADKQLSFWETAGVLESVLYIPENNLTAMKTLNVSPLTQLDLIKGLFGETRVKGFVSVDGEVSYDRFRMRYFRKNSRTVSHDYRKTQRSKKRVLFLDK